MSYSHRKIFLLALVIFALGLGLGACSTTDDPVTPAPGEDDDNTDTDTTAPVLISTNPTSGATGLTINEAIFAIFSEDLDPATLNGNITITPGTVTDLILTDQTVQIVHNPFNEGDQITVTFAVGIADTAGNHLAAPVSHQFWVETQEVQIIEVSPADGSTDVIRNNPVTIKFNQAMDMGLLATGITATTPDRADLGFTIDHQGNSVYAIIFDDDLPAESNISITIGTTCQSSDGIALAEAVSFSFDTGTNLDETPPQIVGFEPAAGSTISAFSNTLRITFDKPIGDHYWGIIRADMITLLALELSEVSYSWNEDRTVLTLVLATPLPPGVELTLQFGDFEDYQGNVNDSHPPWTAQVEGTPDHYPVDERFVYGYNRTITGDKGGPSQEYDMYHNAWTSTDHFQHLRFDENAELWNEWDNMIRTSSAIQLNGFREVDEGTPMDITFDQPVQFLNRPMVAASWSDDVVITTAEGNMDISFSAQVLAGENDFPWVNDPVAKSMALSAVLNDDKVVQLEIFFANCRTIVQDIEGSAGGELQFTETDSLVFCPGFGLIKESGHEVNHDEGRESYFTSDFTNLFFFSDF